MQDAWLILTASDGAERRFPITKERMVIGREMRCDVLVPLPSIGSRHCEVVRDRGVLHVRDLGSIEGTYHNGDRVDDAILEDDDRLTIGPVTFVVRMDRGNVASNAALKGLL